MKLLLLTFFIFLVGCDSRYDSGYKRKSCKDFKKGGWQIGYNKFYDKYIVMWPKNKGENSYLLVDQDGKYGNYAEGGIEAGCTFCADKDASMFSNPCDAVDFLLAYYTQIENNHWQTP